MKILVLNARPEDEKIASEVILDSEKTPPIFGKIKELNLLLEETLGIEGVIFNLTGADDPDLSIAIEEAQNFELYGCSGEKKPIYYVFFYDCVKDNQRIASNLCDNVWRIIVGQELVAGEKIEDLPEDLVKLSHAGEVAIVQYTKQDRYTWSIAIMMLHNFKEETERSIKQNIQ